MTQKAKRKVTGGRPYNGRKARTPNTWTEAPDRRRDCLSHVLKGKEKKWVQVGGRLGGGNLNSFLAASAFSVKEEARSSRESGKPERASATPAA